MNKGILYSFSAYLLWGVFPFYFKAIQQVPAQEILGHRIFWSFLFLTAILLIRREVQSFRSLLTPKVLGFYFVAAVLLAANWYVYVWAVTHDFTVHASLGYFINPLVSVVLGLLILKEKLRPLQWLPVLLATLGVIYITLQLGYLPWISIALALTFGLYGLVKKISPLSSLNGLTLETAMLFPIALVYLGFLQANGSGSYTGHGLLTTLLLTVSGVVTVIPLLLFASGARRIPLSMMGFLQYVSPTIQFLIGVFIFREELTLPTLIGFVAIWIALVFFYAEIYWNQRRTQVAATS